MRTGHVALGLALCISWCVSAAHADLITIGTAGYGAGSYKLIYEDTQGLVWLDYTKGAAIWQTQVDWATGLNAAGVLTYSLNPGTTVDWGNSLWRLPAVDESVVNLGVIPVDYTGPNAEGKYDYSKGYNMTNSEWGHLYYVSLGNVGYRATDGTVEPPGFSLSAKNVAPFDHLNSLLYASGTTYSPGPLYAWSFDIAWGSQRNWHKTDGVAGAMAVRPASVDIGTLAVPLPGAALLGLLGVGTAAGWLKRRRTS